MKPELQKQLFDKYPKIFRQKDLAMQETCMCWGLEVGNGWFKLIDALCSCLQFDTDENNYPQVEATQVKEKFGSLRFYTNGENDKQRGMISFAQSLSSIICETCGTMEGVTQNEKGWISTQCDKCRKEKK
jgi:hypothetical protein